jgi:uncharacterized protein (TIGR02996 family)
MPKTLADMPMSKFWRCPDVAGFSRTFAENPADNLPRLVFADWLEDTALGTVDAEHASLIRSQCYNPSIPVMPSAALRGRLYAGHSSNSLIPSVLGGVNTPDVLMAYDPETSSHILCHLDRGCLSRLTYSTASANPYSLLDFLWGVFNGEHPGPLHTLFAVKRMKNPVTVPYFCFLPYWFDLDSEHGLALENLYAARQDTRLVLRYLSRQYWLEMADVRKLTEGGRETWRLLANLIERGWEDEFKSLGYPMRVRASEDVCRRAAGKLNHPAEEYPTHRGFLDPFDSDPRYGLNPIRPGGP